MSKFTFIDLFSGIGGFTLACERNDGCCIGYSDIDKNALETYKINFNHNDSINFGNITKIDILPEHDLLTAGVPCQSWSIAGKKLGFDDERGKLWNDAIYLLKKSKPKAFIFENVKGLADPRNKSALEYIMDNIQNAGYHASFFIINSNEYGMLQNRIRVFIIGFKDKKYLDSFRLPEKNNNTLTIGDLINIKPNVNKKLKIDYFTFNDIRNGDSVIHSWDIIETTDKEKNICLLLLNNRRKSKYGDKDGNPLSLYDLVGLDKSITEDDINGLINKKILIEFTTPQGIKYDFKNKKASTGLDGVYRIFLPESTTYPTLVASDSNDYVSLKSIDAENITELKSKFIKEIFNTGNYRKINKNEACMLQGIPHTYILPEKRGVWMKLIGNSIPINIVTDLVKSIVDTNVFV